MPWEIPIKTYLAKQPEIFGIVGAAIIIHNNQVLLVQRASADDNPNLWEVPGGMADQDETPVQCAVRELHEETGLIASRVIRMAGEFEWIENVAQSAQIGTKIWKIFMFLMELDTSNGDLKVKLDPKEHQSYLWAGDGDGSPTRFVW